MGKRAIILILDSLGVGYMEDVKENRTQDIGANTFKHILDQAEKIHIPNLERLGINKVLNHPRLILEIDKPMAAYGTVNLQHYGADSYAGHQEIMGTKPKRPLMEPFSKVYKLVRDALISEGYKAVVPDETKPYIVVNGCVVVADNIETDYGQIYNISAPLDEISFDEVVKIGQVVRANVKVNRVIALGGYGISRENILNAIEEREDGLIGVNSPKSGVYHNDYHARHMGYGVNPQTQLASILKSEGKEVVLIGKMQDVIECDGAKRIPAVDTDLVMQSILDVMETTQDGLISATVQETDLAGHAQDVNLYAKKIECVDRYLEQIIDGMGQEDYLFISADHGNDPTIGHSQHTREQTFLLVYNSQLKVMNIGNRSTLADIAATICDIFSSKLTENGRSFYKNMLK